MDGPTDRLSREARPPGRAAGSLCVPGLWCPRGPAPHSSPGPRAPFLHPEVSPIEPRPHKAGGMTRSGVFLLSERSLFLVVTCTCFPPVWAWDLLQETEAGALGSQGNTVLFVTVTGAPLGLWALWGAARLPPQK